MPKPIRKHVKGFRRASPSIAPKFDIGPPISRIDTRPMAIFFVVVFASVLTFWRTPVHSLNFDLPELVDTIFDPQEPSLAGVPQFNQISITANDRLLWNCKAVTDRELIDRLTESQQWAIEPVTVFYPEPNASYNMAARALRMVKASGIRKFEFAGLAQHRNFGTDNSERASGTDSSLNLAFSLVTPTEQPRPELDPIAPTETPYSLCEKESG